jgi:hypothetical protein
VAEAKPILRRIIDWRRNVIAKMKTLAGRVVNAVQGMLSRLGRGRICHDNLATGRIGASGACLLESDFLREFRGARN